LNSKNGEKGGKIIELFGNLKVPQAEPSLGVVQSTSAKKPQDDSKAWPRRLLGLPAQLCSAYTLRRFLIKILFVEVFGFNNGQ
jgi:hypothetical protein